MRQDNARKFGRVVIPDTRDSAYNVHMLLPRRSQRTQRFWNDTQWAGDQGTTPHCVAYSWLHWLHDGPIVPPSSYPKPLLSPSAIYNAARKVDEWPGEDYEGTSVRAGAKVLKTRGLIEGYYWARTVDQVAQTLLELGPVVVGTYWYTSMFKTTKDGLLTISGDIVGGHAYELNGVNTVSRLFRLKQSWGKGFGVNGRAWIKFDDFAKLLSDDGEACIAREKKLTR